MNEKLILNDGTEVNGHILPAGDDELIFVYLDGMSIIDGVTLFSDTEKTSHIVEDRNGVQTEYDGFTRLWSVNSEYGNCNITMKRGE